MNFSKLLAPILYILIAHQAQAQIDLHAHLNMKPGTGPLTLGTFQEEPRAQEWSSRHRTKATSKSFSKSPGAPRVSPLIVVSLYAHPLLTLGHVDEALDQEYQEIAQWVKANSAQFGFAHNAGEAAALIAQKKTALVLSIEGAYGALENETGYKKWIDDRGVAIVTPFHLTEDHFSGVALLEGWRAVNSPLEFFKSILLTGFTCLQSFCKGTIGIKPAGTALIEKLISRNVWIDTAHSSEMDLIELLATLEKKNLPLLVTHTQLRDFYEAERGLGNAEINYIKKHDGIIGLIPTEEMMGLYKKQNPVDCPSGVSYFQKSVTAASQLLGVERIALGSDINAPLKGLSPPDLECTKQPGTDSVMQNGYYTYSQWPELSEHVSPDGIKSTEWNGKTLTHFLQQWKRVRPF